MRWTACGAGWRHERRLEALFVCFWSDVDAAVRPGRLYQSEPFSNRLN